MGTTTLERHFPDVDAWVVLLARAGYIAKGVVYGLIGVLAVMAATGNGGQTAGSKDVIQWIGQQPFGRIVLGLLALGLFGYMIWRLAEAILDVEDEGTDAKGIVKRVGFGISGLIHGALGVAAASTALGGASKGSKGTTLTAELMSQPGGALLVGLVGLIIAGVALYQLKKAWTASFMRDYEVDRMSAREQRWVCNLGRYGLAARGLVFAIAAWFVVQAAASQDAAAANRGLEGALTALSHQPHGPWLLGITALGLASYGVYCLSRAKYRHFSTH